MATRPLTLLMTGGNTGLGLSALQSLLSSPSPHYRIIIGSRSPASATSACASLRAQCPEAPHDVLWLPLDLAERGSVEEFVRGVEEEVGEDGIDCVVLNAAVFKPTLVLQDGGWCEEVLVNHFAQHRLLHLLSPLLSATPALPRIVFVSSTKISSVTSLSSLRPLFRGEEPIPENAAMARYSASKFVQMVAAHGWRMTLQGRAEVLAVSPGFVPTSGLSRDSHWFLRLMMHYILSWAPFCSSLEAGGKGIANAITISSESIHALVSDSDDAVLFLNNAGEAIAVDPRIKEGGAALVEEWMPSIEQMDSWNKP